MTDNKKPTPPTHTIYQVIGEKDNARWIKVGSGWVHRKDGKGLNLIFDSYPIIGRTVIREIDYEAKSAS